MESAFIPRSSSPASSLHSVQATMVLGQDLALNREACAAICVVDRSSACRREIKPGGAPDVRSGSRRASALSLSGATSRAATEEASKVASSLQVTSQFKDHLFGRNCVAEDLLAIAQPVSIDWEEVILYEAFTLSLEDEKVLIAKFPRVDGWLIDDFTPAVLALIELAEVILDCDRLLVCIDRGAAELNCVVRSLLYVGFRVIEQFPVNSAHVSKYFLLSYETE